MVVSKGGSNCAKCEYVRNNNKDCAEPHFQFWNPGPILPAPADIYCCDFWSPQALSLREKYWGKK
jgi:hypothetical protein